MTRFSRYRRTILRSLAASIAAAALIPLAPPRPASAAAPPSCVVDYQILGQSSGGFAAQIILVNLGTPISGWGLVWQMNPGEHLATAWNAVMWQSGTWLVASNTPLNGSLATNASVDFGWSASATTATTPPTAFWLNGAPCLIAPSG